MSIGSRSPIVETELCAAVSDVLVALGFRDFTIRLNHRRVLSGLLQAAGVDAALQGPALVAVDKLDKIGKDGVQAELIGRGVDSAAASRVLETFHGAVSIAHARELVAAIPDAVVGVDELDRILTLSAATSAADYVRFDPSLARGLSYYTGAIMEVAVPDLAGSLGGGGRYDGLIGMFLGEEVPEMSVDEELRHGRLGVVPRPVEAAVDSVLNPLAERVEQCGCGQGRRGDADG